MLPRQDAVPSRHLQVLSVCVCVGRRIKAQRKSERGQTRQIAGSGVLHQAGLGAAQAVRSLVVLAKDTFFRQECTSRLC